MADLRKVNSNNGGARAGAGRKPVKDKRLALTVYVLGSKVAELGGLKAAKEYLRGLIESD